jgi:hypothetical protein
MGSWRASSICVDPIFRPEGIVIHYAARVAAVGSLVVNLIGCGSRGPQLPLKLAPPDFENVLHCSFWTEPEKKRAGIVESSEPAPGFEDIGVIIHLMLADIDPIRRHKEYRIDRAWALAPVRNASRRIVTNVMPREPATEVEFWTPEMIHTFFSRDGKVNEIWKQYHIRLVLLAGEDCTYSPGTLRPDGLVRDSIVSPQTSTPWTSQFFHSINRLFADESPNVLHVFLWWSLAESDVDDVDLVLGGKTMGGNRVWGYSRSAARGGPAVWVGTYDCLKHLKSEPIDSYLGPCAKVIAHEVGHALGLHHVEEPFKDNLMYKDPGNAYRDELHKGVALSELQQEQVLQEAREQFQRL